MAIEPQGHQTVAKWINTIKPKLPIRMPKNKGRSTASAQVAFCPFCGAVLGSSFSGVGECPACHNNIVLSSASEAPRSSSSKPTTLRDRRQAEALEQGILSYAKKGYYVTRQTNEFVEMRRPRKFSPRWAAAWLIGTIPFGGLGIVGYAVWHVAKREATVIIFVDKDGRARIEETSS